MISFPHTTSGPEGFALMTAMGLAEVQSELHRLPPDLVEKLRAVGPFHHITITQADWNAVPKDLQAKILPHLGA